MGIEPAKVPEARTRTKPAPLIVNRTQHGCRINATTGFNGDSVAEVNSKRASRAEKSAADDSAFKRTVQKMLATPPKPHDEMKMGAARKRDARSSGEGAKGRTAK